MSHHTSQNERTTLQTEPIDTSCNVENHVNRTPSTLLRIKISFSDLGSLALLDTGAIVSLISLELFSKIPSNLIEETTLLEDENRTFRTASGHTLKSLGKFSIKLLICNKINLVHTFYVVTQLTEECILGLDFVENHDFIVHAKSRLLIYHKDGKTTHIYVDKEININSVTENKLKSFDLTHLSSIQRPIIEEILTANESVFAEKLCELGKTDVIQHRIETNGEPFALQPYRTPVALRPFIKQHIQEMLDHGIIRHSMSPYRSPVVLVKKKTGDIRFCVDFRKLNSITVPDRYPLPRLDDLIDLLANSRWYSCLDLMSGFWQIGICEADKHKTCFVTEFGAYEFNRLAFGLQGAPSLFQRAMDRILQPVKGVCALVYIDDIIVYSKTLEEHARDLQRVFDLIRESGMKIKASKCSFAKAEVVYLGFKISAKGILPCQDKINAVLNFPTPDNVKKLRSFLGLANFYRKFIANFASKTHVLTVLTKKNVKWKWGPDEQSAFEAIKHCLTSPPILGYPDFSRPYILQSDASGYGVGAVLSQLQQLPVLPNGTDKDDDDSEREVIIAYVSKHLTESQSKWSTTEKEAYAIVHAVKTFYHYLYGNKVVCFTDHRPLEWLMSKKEPTGRLARWALYLQQFEIEIGYKPGANNQNADCLSRNPVNLISTVEFAADDWVQCQHEDSFCRFIIDELNKNKELQTRGGNNRLSVTNYRGRQIGDEDEFRFLPNGLLTTATGKIIVPSSKTKEILERYHDHKLAGHFGINKTTHSIRYKYFWPGMNKQIQRYIRNCLICAKRKAVTTCRAPLQPLPVTDYIWERVSMDIIGPLNETYKGNKYILVILEYSTRYAIAVPMKDQTASTVIRKFIKHVINQEGIPSSILTDLGANFQSSSMKELCKQLGIEQLRTTAYHPQSNAVERLNKTLGDLLTAHVFQDPASWDQHLDYCVAAYNRTIHSSTLDSPFFLLRGRDALEPTDLRPPMRYRSLTDENNLFPQQWHNALELARAHIIIGQGKQKEYYDRNSRICQFQAGDKILLRILHPQVGKFVMRYEGPYVVTEKLSELNYVVRKIDSDSPFVVHVNRMKKWTGTENSTNENVDRGTEQEIPLLQEAAPTSHDNTTEPQVEVTGNGETLPADRVTDDKVTNRKKKKSKKTNENNEQRARNLNHPHNLRQRITQPDRYKS